MAYASSCYSDSRLKSSSLSSLPQKNSGRRRGRRFLSSQRQRFFNNKATDNTMMMSTTTTSERSFSSFSSLSKQEDDATTSGFKMIGSGHIGTGFLPTVSVDAYSAEGQECSPRRTNNNNLMDEHIFSHPIIISLEFEQNVGTWSMVTYLDYGLRRHLRLVRKQRKNRQELFDEENDDGSMYDDYMVRQCQQLVVESFGNLNTTKGTVVDILCDVGGGGRIGVSVNGNESEIMSDCSEMAAACINMFLGKQSCSPSLRRNCIRRQQHYNKEQ